MESFNKIVSANDGVHKYKIILRNDLKNKKIKKDKWINIQEVKYI